MNLTDAERKENREALKAMTLSERLDHVFEYYKFPLALALIAVVALGSVLYYKLTRRDALLYVACANIAVGEDLDDAIGEGYVRAIGANPRRCEVRLYRNLYLSRDATVQNHEYAYASQLKVMAAMANGQLDVALMNQEAYDILSAGGYLMPLEGFLKGELSGRTAGRLVSNTVILSDNDIEHRLDESTPYRAETEEVANAILISAFPLFAQADFSGDVYLGVVGNSERTEAVLQYIDYLTSPPQDSAA